MASATTFYDFKPVDSEYLFPQLVHVAVVRRQLQLQLQLQLPTPTIAPLGNSTVFSYKADH